MGFWEKWTTKNVRSEEVKKESRTTGDYTSEQQQYRQHEDLRTLKNAIETAENIINPNREDLHRIYSEIVEDPHLAAQWETRKMKTIEREFAVYKKGSDEPDDERTEILSSSWFFDFIHAVLDSKLWGFSLIEFGKWENNKFNYYRDKKNKLHKPIEVVNRDHVKPEFGYLLRNPSDIEGIDIFKPPVSNRTLFVGGPKDYGILRKCAKYILFKNNCLSNWSEWAEVFAHDIRIGKTDAEGSERKKLFDALKKMGASGYGVFDKEDIIEYLGTSRTDAYQVYDALNRYIDENISKLIFGQDVVMNHSGRVRGTAAETITDLYGNNDAWFIQGIVNDELFPKMSRMGINMDGYELRWDNSEKLDLQEKADVDLKISQMGFTHDPDYINETYGTRVEVKEMQGPKVANPEKVAEALKNIYGVRGTK